MRRIHWAFLLPFLVIPVCSCFETETSDSSLESDSYRISDDVSLDDRLIYAIRHDQTEHAKGLVKRGADVNATFSKMYGWTPLMEAVRQGNGEIARFLIKKGAAVDAANNNGTTALMFALWEGQEDVATILISNGADVERVDVAGTTLMHAAVGSGPEIIQLLIDKGAAMHPGGPDGERTVLDIAYESKNYQAIEALIENGADPNRGRYDFSRVLESDEFQKAKEYQQIRERDDHSNGLDEKLERAIFHLDVVDVEYFFKQGAQISQKEFVSFLSDWPKSRAKQKTNREIVELILTHGSVDIDYNDLSYGTSLKRAIRAHDVRLLELLLSHGANPNLVDKKGHTPLFHVFAYTHAVLYGEDNRPHELKITNTDGQIEMINLLVQSGARADLDPDTIPQAIKSGVHPHILESLEP